MNYETFQTSELNDLERPTALSSDEENSKAFQTFRAEGTAQGTGASGSAGSFGGAAAGSISGALGGIMAAIVTVTVMVVVLATTVFSPPKISATDWQILHNQISFLFEGEASGNDYLITLYESDTVVSSVALSEPKGKVVFDSLQAQKDYVITIENDYGMGVYKLKEFRIRTAGEPIAPEGRITITSHQIDYASATLALEFELLDDYNYLSNFRINIADGIYDTDIAQSSLPAALTVSLSGMKRGFITVKIYADSTGQNGGDNLLFTEYKIYY